MVQQENAPLDDNIELGGLLSDVLEDAKRVAAPMGIQVNCEGQFPIIQMRGNEILLYRAISNIVENAIKYNRPDGKVLVSCQKTVGNAIIRVQDTGHGIPDDAKDSIFEPFYRIRSNQEGLGLGLSFAKSVITMHGGIIGVDSVLNVGSTFVIKIPVE
jgi:signal transduction histidine kinase